MKESQPDFLHYIGEQEVARFVMDPYLCTTTLLKLNKYLYDKICLSCCHLDLFVSDNYV